MEGKNYKHNTIAKIGRQIDHKIDDKAREGTQFRFQGA